MTITIATANITTLSHVFLALSHPTPLHSHRTLRCHPPHAEHAATQSHFELNPKETQLLNGISHVGYLDQKRVMAHLKYLPKYLVGDGDGQVLDKASNETQELPKNDAEKPSSNYVPQVLAHRMLCITHTLSLSLANKKHKRPLARHTANHTHTSTTLARHITPHKRTPTKRL